MRPAGTWADVVSASPRVAVAITAAMVFFILPPQPFHSFCWNPVSTISELVANTKLNFSSAARRTVRHDWIAVVQSQRPDWQIEPHPETSIRFQAAETEIISILIDIANIEKYRAAHALDDRYAVLRRPVDVRVAADRLIVDVLRADLAVGEPPQRIRPTEKIAVENRHRIDRPFHRVNVLPVPLDDRLDHVRPVMARRAKRIDDAGGAKQLEHLL